MDAVSISIYCTWNLSKYVVPYRAGSENWLRSTGCWWQVVSIVTIIVCSQVENCLPFVSGLLKLSDECEARLCRSFWSPLLDSLHEVFCQSWCCAWIKRATVVVCKRGRDVADTTLLAMKVQGDPLEFLLVCALAITFFTKPPQPPSRVYTSALQQQSDGNALILTGNFLLFGSGLTASGRAATAAFRFELIVSISVSRQQHPMITGFMELQQ